MIAILEDILQSQWWLFDLSWRDFRLDLLLEVLKFCLFFCQTEVVSNIISTWR
jgi:hypothetical protein